MSEEGIGETGQKSSSDTEEIKELLEQEIEITKENNKLLRQLHRNAMIGLIAKVVIWLIILGVPLFFLGPYLKPFFSLITTGQMPEGSGTESILGLPSADQLQEIITIYGGQ